MPETKSKLPDWAFADGSPKPEYVLSLRTPLSDGTNELHLCEPSIGTIRRASKLLDKEESTDGLIAAGIALVSGVTNLKESLIEELPKSTFNAAAEYLNSFK
jgi:hypothetical protein